MPFWKATKFDIFFWFDYSTKRKNRLVEYCEFCDTEYRNIMKYMNMHWLNLEIVVEHILRQYDGLKFYVLSVNDGTPRLQKLKEHFDDPTIQVYLICCIQNFALLHTKLWQTYILELLSQLAMVTETKGQNFLRMGVIWDYLSKLKDLSGNFKFPLLSKVASR